MMIDDKTNPPITREAIREALQRVYTDALESLDYRSSYPECTVEQIEETRTKMRARVEMCEMLAEVFCVELQTVNRWRLP